MRPTSIALRGFLGFRGLVELELEEPGLVALVGPNGAGKTTIIEAVPAALFGEFPSRPAPSLATHAHGTDAFAEVRFVDAGVRYVSRVDVNAERRTVLRTLARDEVALANSTDEHRSAVGRIFGSLELLQASVFACQTREGSFLRLTRAERKRLLVEMLGLDRLQVLASIAGRHETTAKATVVAHEGSLRRLAAADLEALRGAVADAERLLVDGDTNLAAARSIGDGLRLTLEEARRQHAVLGPLRQAELSAAGAVEATSSRLDAALASLEALRNAKARELKALGPTPEPSRSALERALEANARSRKRALEDHARRVALAQAGHAERVERLEALAGTDAPCRAAPTWSVPFGPSVDLAGSCGFLEHQRKAAAELGGLTTPAVAPLDVAEFAAFEAAAQEAYAAEVAAWAQAEAARALERSALREAHDARLAAADTERELARAASDVACLEAKRAADALAAALAGLVDVGQAEQALQVALASLRDAERERERLVAALADARGKLARAEELQAERLVVEHDLAGAREDLADWALLERALGPAGLQALEIAAAVPETAAIANDLLAATYGSRFALRFDTTREKAAGGTQEVLDVVVLDRGVERRADFLSGGEQVIVSEAIGLALAIANKRKSRVNWETIFRDETAGALDPYNADRYVRMLRAVLEVGGFRQVVFVAHLPQVYEAADVRWYVEGGTVHR